MADGILEANQVRPANPLVHASDTFGRAATVCGILFAPAVMRTARDAHVTCCACRNVLEAARVGRPQFRWARPEADRVQLLGGAANNCSTCATRVAVVDKAGRQLCVPCWAAEQRARARRTTTTTNPPTTK